MGGRCGGSNTCACAVQQGTGITVTGNGTAENPYIVSISGAAATHLGATDSPTVDFTLTGDGSVGDPFSLTAVVPDGVVVPNANATLDLIGAKIAEGLAYNATTREFTVALSADAGNMLGLGSDSGLYVSIADLDPSPLWLSTTAGNALQLSPDDALLYVPPGAAVPSAAWLSTNAGNHLVLGSDAKLMVPESYPPLYVKATVDTTAPLIIDVIGGLQNQPAEPLGAYAPVAGTNVFAIRGASSPAVPSFVQAHNNVQFMSTSNTFNGASIGATANAVGNVLLLWISMDTGSTNLLPYVVSIGKPAGETASWVKLGAHDGGQAGAAAVRGELWAIKTTMAWPTSTAYAITLSESVVGKMAMLREFFGVTTAMRAPAGSHYHASGAVSATVNGVLAGDLVVGAATWEYNIVPTTDTDTVGGAWSAMATHLYNSGVSNSSMAQGMQHKIPNVAGSQTFNPIGQTVDAGGVVVALIPDVVYTHLILGDAP